MDSEGHGIATWAWSDGGAGGTFSDPASAQTAYTAPDLGAANFKDIPLTATATCDGASPLTASGSTLLTMLRAQNVYQPGEVVEELPAAGSFSGPWFVSVNPTDGSCWVADWGNKQVVHLAADGTELWRGGSFTSLSQLAVNPADGSCWVTDRIAQAKQIVLAHLAPNGAELWRGVVLTRTCDVGLPTLSVNPDDGSCWLTACGGSPTVHVAQDGTELGRVPYGGGLSIAVNPADGSVWTFRR